MLWREPWRIFHAQFWAEDGAFWYSEAYSFGWHSLLLPRAGYLQTISRLIALAAQPFPLAASPTLFVIVSLAFNALPAAWLCSARLDAAWPSRSARILLALIYVSMPNTTEVLLNVTNIQWHLATLAFLLLLASSAEQRWKNVAEIALLALCGLSGPFCLFLAPVAAWRWLARRTPVALARLAVIAVTAAIQGALVIETGSRSVAPLGATAMLLARIVSLQVVTAGLLGSDLSSRIANLPFWVHGYGPALIFLLALAVTLIALWRGSPNLRQAILVASLLLTAALLKPMVELDQPQWPVLAIGGGNRYYFIPMLVWIGVCLYLAGQRSTLLRGASALALSLLTIGIWSDFHPAPLPPLPFAASARAFATAAPGTTMTFPIQPVGWKMILTKH